MFMPRDLQTAARAAAMLFSLTLAPAVALAQSDPLPSWNDTAPKAAIVEFVEKVSKEGSPDFVPEPNASRCSTMTARCGPSSRCMSSLPSRSIV